MIRARERSGPVQFFINQSVIGNHQAVDDRCKLMTQAMKTGRGLIAGLARPAIEPVLFFVASLFCDDVDYVSSWSAGWIALLINRTGN